ncbi:MAG TPA: hypothetical protein VH475_13870 [Tepidisphaeraceae bacterium]
MRRNAHRRHPLPFAILAVALALVANLTVRAAADDKPQAQQQEPTKFLRFVEEGRDGGRLETADAAYTNGKGVTVHLIGAIHIADPGYYAALNKSFENYDALLYEMVKPADMDISRRGVGNDDGGIQANGVGLVHILQKGLKMFLDLDYQLDGIDYTRKNFVHADLTAEEFNRMQDERGESIFGLMLQQMMKELMKGDAAGKAQDIDPMDLLGALSGEDSARHLKLILAKQFENMDDMVAGLDGPNGSVLVTERNKACLRVLKQQIAAGRKNIGIFYGAAHLKDMEKRLQDEFGFKRTGVQYRVAWDLGPNANRAGAANNAPAANNNRAGQLDDRDETIKKLLDKIDHLEKRLDDVEKDKQKK